MSSSATQTTVNGRDQLYRLTTGILNSHSLHFIIISFLFLPLTFSASAAVQFSSSSGTDVTTMFDPLNLRLIKTVISSSQNLLHVKTLITTLVVTCCIIFSTVAGIALITNSTKRIIHRQPITFSSSVKSLSCSFMPLFHTFMAGLITLIVPFLVFTLLPLAIIQAVKALGLHFDLDVFTVVINTIFSYALVITIIFFVIIWGSAAAITVLESKSGFEALRQSANQSTEFRHHSYSIVMVTGFGINTARLILKANLPMMILYVGAICLTSSLMILVNVVANTVLYLQCKIIENGEEIAMKTAEGEVSGEYVRLTVTDEDDEVVHELAEEMNGARASHAYAANVDDFAACGGQHGGISAFKKAIEEEILATTTVKGEFSGNWTPLNESHIISPLLHALRFNNVFLRHSNHRQPPPTLSSNIRNPQRQFPPFHPHLPPVPPPHLRRRSILLLRRRFHHQIQHPAHFQNPSYSPRRQLLRHPPHCRRRSLNHLQHKPGHPPSDYSVGIEIRIRGSTTKRESIDGVSTSLIFHIVHHRIRDRHGAGKFDPYAKFRSDIELDPDLAGRYLVFGTVIDNFAVCGGELGVVCAVQDRKRGRDCYGNGGRGGFRRRRVC
ncbi:hypothetical protein E3N88_37506 [Mikania micrantha]|uniref:Uncharacterized protein n=1 Tax=Mikania micrantha TaxID=192012 RepID=A0A5N6LRE2_9ASTR|nr:hypothetical protein E3N88_37506 [Mikania micrantha]